MSRNELDHETSPYLLQHKDNPVHWRAWGPAALAEAKTANKPILLSVGYAACHWCHVMAHESFEDAETANLMNDLFVCIKVDREERPDVDMLYQTALQAMRQQGGWPLTMFLTPAGEAYGGGTYFPPEPKFNRPAFKQVLTDAAKIFRENPDQVEQNRAALAERLKQVWESDRKKPIGRTHLEFASQRIAQAFDVFSGGLDGAPKFPSTPLIELMWRSFLRTGAQPYGQSALNTLNHICQGGIYDHLGGGFARYSVDARWLVPHFEKMLYDNAQLIDVLTLVWQGTRMPLYRERIAETADWIVREMQTNDGGFAASFDADSDGVEGKYYIWSETEIDAVLTPARSALFKQVYDVTAQGNWEGANILNRLRAMNYLQPEQEALLSGQRKQLLKARGERTRPLWDDKVLADWNGLAIAALVSAANVFQKPEWHLPAVKAFWFIAEKMTHGAQGENLFHAYRSGKAQHEGTADDYAFMSRAALALFEVTSDPRYLDRAKAWTRVMDEEFWDESAGGYFMTAKRTDDLPLRPKVVVDQSTPSPNGVMAQVQTRLHFLTGEARYRKRAEDTLNAFGVLFETQFSNMGTMMNAAEFAMAPLLVTIVKQANDPRVQPLYRVIYEHSMPNRIVSVVASGEDLPKIHPAHGKAMVENRPTVYLCAGQTCSPPITDPKNLEAVLKR